MPLVTNFQSHTCTKGIDVHGLKRLERKQSLSEQVKLCCINAIIAKSLTEVFKTADASSNLDYSLAEISKYNLQALKLTFKLKACNHTVQTYNFEQKRNPGTNDKYTVRYKFK